MWALSNSQVPPLECGHSNCEGSIVPRPYPKGRAKNSVCAVWVVFIWSRGIMFVHYQSLNFWHVKVVDSFQDHLKIGTRLADTLPEKKDPRAILIKSSRNSNPELWPCLKSDVVPILWMNTWQITLILISHSCQSFSLSNHQFPSILAYISHVLCTSSSWRRSTDWSILHCFCQFLCHVKLKKIP